MRIERRPPDQVFMVLSERNLITLLAKLRQGDSARTLMCADAEGSVWVTAEHDKVHYAERPPTPVLPSTEALVKDGK